MPYRRKITPPADLAAVIDRHRNSVSYDPQESTDALDPDGVAASGLEIGRSYVVNADGTLTPTVQPATRNTTAAPGRHTR